MSSLLVIHNKHLRDGGNDWKNMKTFESLDSLPANHLPLKLNICLHLNIWWNVVELKWNCSWERDNATAIYSNDQKWCHLQQCPCYGCCIVNETQKHTEPINDGEKPAGSWAPAAPGGPQLPSSVPDVENSTQPLTRRDCHPLPPPSWGAGGSIPNPFPCAKTGITESLVLLPGAHQGRSWKAGFPISSDGLWNEFACKPLIPVLLKISLPHTVTIFPPAFLKQLPQPRMDQL